MIFLQQSVGFLVLLALTVLFGIRCYEYAVGPARGRAVLCGIVAVLCLIAMIVALHI